MLPSCQLLKAVSKFCVLYRIFGFRPRQSKVKRAKNSRKLVKWLKESCKTWRKGAWQHLRKTSSISLISKWNTLRFSSVAFFWVDYKYLIISDTHLPLPHLAVFKVSREPSRACFIRFATKNWLSAPVSRNVAKFTAERVRHPDLQVSYLEICSNSSLIS